MKILVTLDIPTKEVRTLTGASKSKVYREAQNGKDVGKLWENLGKAINAKVLSARVLTDDFGKDVGKPWESHGKTQESERKEDLSPTPPIEENKGKENIIPPKLKSENIKFSSSIPPKGRRDFGEDEEISGEVKKDVFYPPTVGEVQAYIGVKGYLTDAEEFVAFYESKGWMIGKNRMKNWRMALVTWEKARKRKSTDNGYGKDRRNPRCVRGATPVLAASAKDYEGRF